MPSDVIAFVVFCRLRYWLTLRGPSEIKALRGIKVGYEAVRDWRLAICDLALPVATSPLSGDK